VPPAFPPSSVAGPLTAIARRLADRCAGLSFGPPVAHVYQPLLYAKAPAEAYLARLGAAKGRVVLLGMNPGPWGMSQTGVPFGDVAMVREWLGIEGPVGKPHQEHPKRRVLGFSCPRSEVSGSRLWGWARDRFGTPEAFFRRFLVWNYCPLAFLEESGRNRTPDRLPPAERETLLAACDEAVRDLVDAVEPSLVVGIGGFAQDRARRALAGRGVPVARIPHPSPASPAANRGWADDATRALRAAGVDVPDVAPMAANAARR
jgi:single-strand selective monofunctional uracil DNA glycosylase